MKKQTFTREEMIDALVENDVEMWKHDEPTVNEMLEVVSRYGHNQLGGWESYSDERIKEEYEELLAANTSDED